MLEEWARRIPEIGKKDRAIRRLEALVKLAQLKREDVNGGALGRRVTHMRARGHALRRTDDLAAMERFCLAHTP